MSYTCPYATRFKGCRYLGCKKQMQNGVDYNLLQNQLNVMCPHQRWCTNEMRAVNTDLAKQCLRLSQPTEKKGL